LPNRRASLPWLHALGVDSERKAKSYKTFAHLLNVFPNFLKSFGFSNFANCGDSYFNRFKPIKKRHSDLFCKIFSGFFTRRQQFSLVSQVLTSEQVSNQLNFY
jgi:hypothetical protein